MDPVFLTLFAITLIGLALLIVAGGVAIIMLLRRMRTVTLQMVQVREENEKISKMIGKMVTQDNLVYLLTPISDTVTAVHNRITFISNELVPWNARSTAMFEALNVMAEGIDNITNQMEKKMSKTRYIELGDAQPAMGIVEDASTLDANAFASATPAAKPKRVRKPAKKAAKKAPAKKARKSAKKK